MDSGSATTLVSLDIFEQIAGHEKFEKIPLETRYAAFMGTEVPAIGKYRLNLNIGKAKTNAVVLVVDHPDKTQPHCLLGVDMIRSKRLGIENNSSTIYLTFYSRNQLKRLKLEPSQPLYVAQTTQVDGGELKDVKVSLLPQPDKVSLVNRIEISGVHGTALIESNEDMEIPQESLGCLDDNGEFYIPLLNKNHGELLLLGGQQIGTFNILTENTILKNEDNIVEIVKSNKLVQDIPACLLKLRKINHEKTNQVHFLNKLPETKEQVLTFKPSPGKTKCEIDGNEIGSFNQEKGGVLSAWTNMFYEAKNSHFKDNNIFIDASSRPVLDVNRIQMAANGVFTNKNLFIHHPDLTLGKVNKVKIFNEETISEDEFSEDDLVEGLLQHRRIDSSKETWESLLKEVPESLRKKVFHLLTTKHDKVVAKSTVDFGLCEVPNSKFKICLKDETPITTKPYPLNFVYRSFIQETLENMLSNNLLLKEPSNFGSGVFGTHTQGTPLSH